MGDIVSKLVWLKRITDGGFGAKPPAAGEFFVIFWKNSYFNANGSHFERF